VWELLEEAMRHTRASMIFLERDSDFYPFESIMDDIVRAREIFYQQRPAEPVGITDAVVAGDEASSAAPTIDPLDERFTDLRSYQRAVLGQITDAEFSRAVAETPDAVQRQFPMSPDWQRRWQGCDQWHIGAMSRKWPETRRRNQEMEEELKRLELRMLSGGGR
jgi:hypothetical protein